METIKEQSSDTAIIGISCITAGAADRHQFWRNILNGVTSITEVPPGRWDSKKFYSANRRDRDKIPSMTGGFIPALPFDPMRYGMPSDQVSATEPLQLLSLEAVRMVLGDAGYENRSFDRDRTAIIIGTGGGLGELEHRYVFRTYLTQYFDGKIPEELLAQLPKWNKDSLPGILPSVTAGRIANRFGFGGPNFVTDAACASSLVAVQMAVRELNAGTSDTAIVGGADTYMGPFTYLSFGRTQALSESGKCKPFDCAADGTVMGEAIAFIMLKRLTDAVRDKDRIYARIKGLGGSSDGRGKGLTAPNLDGQVRALSRAYESAGVSPETISLIEAHGTGTVVGDTTEIESLNRIFSSAKIRPQSIPIGSVKSMIGHAKTAAGLISLIKTALALYHKVLPPTRGIDTPIPLLGASPFYPNLKARPWIHNATEHPRRAGVSAFGFGGANFHAVLEENIDPAHSPRFEMERPCELFYFRGETPEALVRQIDALKQRLRNGQENRLFTLAQNIWSEHYGRSGISLSIVADSVEDLAAKLDKASDAVTSTKHLSGKDPQGVYYYPDAPLEGRGTVAFLFPGQGAQYPDMFAEEAIYFEEIREALEEADATLTGRVPGGISKFIFPPAAFSPHDKKSAVTALAQTEIAQPALGAVEMGLNALLRACGITPDFLAGHSYGEYVALCAAGAMDTQTLYRISEARGAIIRDAAGDIKGAMSAAQTDAQTVQQALEGLEGVWISNRNAPNQTVISGTCESVNAAARKLTDIGVEVKPLAVSCAFHSPLVASAKEKLSDLLSRAALRPPPRPVFSNRTGNRYDDSGDGIVAGLCEHMVNGVDFVKEIESMYAQGIRIFLECGPRNILTNLTGEILKGRGVITVAVDTPGAGGVAGLLYALAHLAALNVPVDLNRLYLGLESSKASDREQSRQSAALPRKSPWMVDGGMAWRLDGAADDSAGGRPVVKPVPFGVGSILEINTNDSKEHCMNVTDLSTSRSDLLRDFFERQRGLTQQLLELQNSFIATLGGQAAPNAALPPLESGETDVSLFTMATMPIVQTDSAPAPAPSAVKEESTSSIILGIVSEKTGYPSDLLDLDANLEGDLGIDSIKRTEISGAIHKRFLSLPQKALHILPSAKSLRTIIDIVEINNPVSGGPTDGAVQIHYGVAHEDSTTQARFRMEAVCASPPLSSTHFPPHAVVVITSDEGECVLGISRLLREAGVTPMVLTPGKALTMGDIPVDITDPSAVGKLFDRISAEGAIIGVIHAAPLRSAPEFGDMSFTEWQERIRLDCKSLLCLAQAAGPYLEAAYERGDLPFFMGVVGASALTPDDDPRRCAPWQGGVTGFINTLAIEWPNVHCRIVDIGLCPESKRASLITAEITGRDGHRLIAYRGEQRLVPRFVRHLHTASAGNLSINQDTSIIITGGARGITSEIARELACRFQPKLLLAGRSPLPKAESPDTAGITSKMELTRILSEKSAKAGRQSTLREIERDYERLCRDREIIASISAMREAGARVQYVGLDLSTEQGVGELIKTAMREYGGIDGIIHGAGIIEDCLIKDKTPESFSRVMDTKANSAFLIYRAMEKLSLKFAVFFSSVARFGSVGQADYAAANEILDLIAAPLPGKPDCRVASISWGPWLSRGMTEKLDPSIFQSKGCEPVSIVQGRAWLIDELIKGKLSDSSIILGNGPWSLEEEPPLSRLA